MSKGSILPLLFSLALLVSCKKDKAVDANAIPNSLDFSSYRMFNDVGDAIGLHGTGIDDEYQMEEWDKWVYNLFKPLDTASLAGTTPGTATLVQFFPNPCETVQAVVLKATTTTAFKFVIINEEGEAKLRLSKKLEGNVLQHLQYSLATIPNGYYRIYYSFSGENDEHFYRAHADIEKK